MMASSFCPSATLFKNEPGTPSAHKSTGAPVRIKLRTRILLKSQYNSKRDHSDPNAAFAWLSWAAYRAKPRSSLDEVFGIHNGSVAKACCATVGVAQLAIRLPLTPIAIITSSASPTATRLKPTTLEPNVIGRDGLLTRYCCNSPVFTRRLYSTV